MCVLHWEAGIVCPSSGVVLLKNGSGLSIYKVALLSHVKNTLSVIVIYILGSGIMNLEH